MARRNPLLRSVVLASALTEYNLYDLLQALDSDIADHCQMIQIQFDWGAEADLLYIGNPGHVGPTDRGVELGASQAATLQSLDANLILVKDIALMCSGTARSINVTMVTR